MSSLPKQKLSSLTLGTLSSRSDLYLHRPGPRKPQWLPVDCFVDESPTERSPLGGHSSLCDGMSLILRGSASWVPPAFASARDCCVSNQSMPRERSGCLLMLDSQQRAMMPGTAQETRPPARAAWVCSVPPGVRQPRQRSCALPWHCNSLRTEDSVWCHSSWPR